MNVYEQRCYEELERWRSEPPGVIAQSMDRLLAPAVRAVQAMVPESAFRAALEATNRVAVRLAARERVLKRAGLGSLDEIRTLPLERNDELFRSVRRRALQLAAGSGVATGVAGAAGLAVDVPALLTLSLNSIHRAGYCYGYDAAQEGLALAIFALASANTLEEKQAAWEALQSQQHAATAALRDGLERAAQRELGKQAAVTGLQTLARQLGLNLGRRKALGVVPILGALVGGSANAWYMYDLCAAARFAFLSRRLASA
ncbi:MAG: EcsC family protein [Nevskiales bacterium]